LLVGIVGAVVLATVAGARRSDSALRRFNDWSRTGNLEINPGSVTSAQLAEFRKTPGLGTLAVLDLPAIQPQLGSVRNLAVGVPRDATLGGVIDRARVIEGRAANPDAPDEIDAGEGLASLLNLRVGSTVPFDSWTVAQVRQIMSTGNFTPAAGPPINLHVVGIVRRPLDLGTRGGAGGVLVLTPAFDRKYGGLIGSFNGMSLRIRTAHPSDVGRVTAAAEKIWGSSPQFQVQDLAIDTTGAGDAIHVLAISLYIFAAIAALAGLVAIAIVLTRELSTIKVEEPMLRAIGATRGQRLAMNGLRVGIIAAAGATIAVVAAIAASPLFPFGIARRADPDPGLHVDWRVVVVGVFALVFVIAAISLIAGWRATRIVSSTAARPHYLGARAAESAATSGLPVSMSTGVRLAIDPGRGDKAVPVRSAVLGMVVGVLGLAAVMVFATSLDHLATTPRLYGWTFGFQTPSFDPVCDRNDQHVGSVAGVAAMAAVCYENIEVNGRAVTGWGWTPVRGDIEPEVVTGRVPRTPGEVALGATTLRATHTEIGSTVVARSPLGSRSYRVVGEVVFPQFTDPQALADGAWFAEAGFDPLIIPPGGNTKNSDFERFVVGDFAPGVNPASVEAQITKVSQSQFGESGQSPAGGQQRPVEVDRLRQTSWFPAALAALLGLLALVAVSHALVTGTRRRRDELGLLKTLGFERGQVRSAIAWQATVLALTGVVVGIPLGVVTGVAIWRAIANSLGVVNGATVPLLILTLAPVAIVAVNAVAYFPARRAARIRPGVALRSE
jgi:ABC-type lipoprotein release transport system permease subunit